MRYHGSTQLSFVQLGTTINRVVKRLDNSYWIDDIQFLFAVRTKQADGRWQAAAENNAQMTVILIVNTICAGR